MIVYRTGWLNYEIGRRVVRLSHVGLPNIVGETPLAPELIQGDLTPQRLAAALTPWLDDVGERERARTALRGVRERLGGPGASVRAAVWLWEMVA